MISLKLKKSWKTSKIHFWAILALPMGEQVATLPQGRFMLSFMTLLGGISGQFANTGALQPISDQFNRSINFAQIAAEDPARTVQIQGLLDSQGVPLEASAGQFAGRFEGSLQAMIPLIGYGITERWGVFVTAPILKLRTRFATAFQASQAYTQVMSDWAASDQSGLASNIQAALSTGMEQKIVSAGYRYEPTSERTLIGDLQIVSPWIVTPADRDLQVGILNQFSLPTGQVARTDDLYGIGVGAGRLVVGTGVGASYRLGRRWLFAGSLGGSIAMPAQMAKRLPTAAGDNLSPDIDDNTQVAATPSFKVGVESRFRISRSWTTRVGYQYQLEASSNFSGSSYSADRYALLSRTTGQELHTLSAGVDFSLIQAFIDGDFLFPTQLSLAAALPVAGRNTMADFTCLVQASLFF